MGEEPMLNGIVCGTGERVVGNPDFNANLVGERLQVLLIYDTGNFSKTGSVPNVFQNLTPTTPAPIRNGCMRRFWDVCA